jgi:hypothetical protein
VAPPSNAPEIRVSVPMIRGAPLPNTYRMGLLARNALLRVAYPLASDGPQDGEERDSDGNFYEGKCALALLSISHSRNYSKSAVDLSSPIFTLPTPSAGAPYARARFGSISSATSDLNPARNRRDAAHAIMAALSVHNHDSGVLSFTPARSHPSCSWRRNS